VSLRHARQAITIAAAPKQKENLVSTTGVSTAPRLEILLRKDLDTIPQLQNLTADQRLDMRAVSAVLPFRVNRYVVDSLIDWDKVPDDPIYQLTFPQPGMLAEDALARMRDLVVRNVPKDELEAAAREIQHGMNPHPAGQMELTVRRCCSSRAQDRPVTPTARTASAGHSLSASTN